MNYSVAKVKEKLPQILRAFEQGEEVVITRHGRPIAKLCRPSPDQAARVKLGTMKNRIVLLPGWDEPIDTDRFLAGEI